jgi:hypothetical protein
MPVDGSMTRSGLLTLMLAVASGGAAAALAGSAAATSRVTSRAGLSRRRATKTEWRHVPLGRPFAERHLGDQLRPHPALGAGAAPRPATGRDRIDGERRRLGLERDQARVQVARGARVPAGADVAGVDQRALVPGRQEQAAHSPRAPLRSVKPQITNSWRSWHFSFSQVSVRCDT